MRKIKIIKYVGVMLFIIYVATMVLASFSNYFGDFNVIAFTLVLALLSLHLCYKGTVLHSYSTLWFALNLVLYALLILYFEIMKIDYNGFYFLFAFLPIVPSLILVFLGKAGYLKVIILDLSVALPLTIFNFPTLNLWLKIGVFAFSILLGIFICKLFSLGKERI